MEPEVAHVGPTELFASQFLGQWIDGRELVSLALLIHQNALPNLVICSEYRRQLAWPYFFIATDATHSEAWAGPGREHSAYEPLAFCINPASRIGHL